MKISELKKIVGERVVQLTNGLQKPTSRNETITVDWEYGDVNSFKLKHYLNLKRIYNLCLNFDRIRVKNITIG